MPIGCQAAIYAAEGRREVAVTHLALARSQNCRKRHFGVLSREKVHVQDTKDFTKAKRAQVSKELERSTKDMDVQKK